MGNFLIMFICLVAGQLIRRGSGFAVRDVRPLNVVILFLSLPALILVQVPPLFHSSAINGDFAYAIAMPWLHFLIAAVVIGLVGHWRRWSRPVIGALTLTAGLGNTSFIGLPVVEALYGEAGVRIAIVIDQVGSFLILATFGLLVASYYSGRDLSVKVVLRRVLLFPPFLAFVISAAWGLLGLPMNETMIDALKKIGGTLVPLALLSVGWQLELNRSTFRRYVSQLGVGLTFKLVLWPLAVMSVLSMVLRQSNLVYKVTVIEAAMATMITSAVVATEFDLESELAQLMVGVGIPLSALTLLIWALALKAV